MEKFEQQQFKANGEKNQEKEIEITKEQITQRIHKMKYEAAAKPDALNLHLKNIDERVLFTSLEDADYNAFKKAFNDEWTEDSEEFKQYMEDVLEWEKRELMDSGISPKLKARRDFSTMIRHCIVTLSAEKKLKSKEE